MKPPEGLGLDVSGLEQTIPSKGQQVNKPHMREGATQGVDHDASGLIGTRRPTPWSAHRIAPGAQRGTRSNKKGLATRSFEAFLYV